MKKNIEKDYIVIIPVHSLSGEYDVTLFERSVASVPTDVPFAVIIDPDEKSCGQVSESLSAMKREGHVLHCDPGKTDFCSMVNAAVESLPEKYGWFSILEFDDEYTPSAFRCFERYRSSMPEVALFMPLVEIDSFNGDPKMGYNMVQFSNEAVWAAGFSEIIGVPDLESVKDFYNFNMTGCFFRRSEWGSCGGLKSDIPVSFWYEFLMRWIYRGLSVYTMPKLGYKHYSGRKGSLSLTVKEGFGGEEVDALYRRALDEYTKGFSKDEDNELKELQ